MQHLDGNYSIKNEHKISLPQEAMRNIARIIGDMKLKPGDKLPSEAELCAILNVSRVVVREAISGLNAVGLVERRQGYGNVVTGFTQSLINPSTLFIDANLETLLEVVEARRIFEVEIAKIAARNRSEEDIKLIERYHLAMGACENSIDDIADNDINFHLALVCCTQNKFLFRFMSGVCDIMKSSRRESFKDPTALARAMKEHEAIIDAVRGRNPEKAAAAMDRHLLIVEEKVRARLV